MKKLYLFVMLLFVAVCSVLPQKVSVDEALSRARKFVGGQSVQTRLQQSSGNLELSYTARSGNETYFYVFNRGTDGGFVIVGGDEAAREIIGYSTRGRLDMDCLPCNVRGWLDQYTHEISHAIREVKAGRAKIMNNTALTRSAKANIPYLVQTKWDQDYPYNCEIPLPTSNPDESLLTGCVATAAAQVLKYYEWPKTGRADTSYTWNISELGVTKTFSADFGSTTYDWGNMLNTYVGPSTDVQKRAVGTLMYHLGVASGMMYGTYDSGAFEVNMARGLADYFRYDRSISYESRSHYSSTTEWESMIYDELSCGRPVIYCGMNGEGAGHAFVCDGYEDGRFHINWGWSGFYDGYFSLTGVDALWPEGQGNGGGDGCSGFVYDQTAITGIRPDAGGRAHTVAGLAGESLEIDYEESVRGAYLNLSATPIPETGDTRGLPLYNAGVFSASFTYGVMLRGVTTSDSYTIQVRTASFAPGQGVATIDFNVPSNAAFGEYEVVPIYKDETNVWRTVKGAFTFPHVTIVPPNQLSLAGAISVCNGGYVAPGKFEFTLRVKNPTQTPVRSANLMLYVFDSRSAVHGYFTLPSMFAANEEKEYVVNETTNYSGKAFVAGARYRLYLLDYASQRALSGFVSFQVTEPNVIGYRLTSVGWGTICLPYEAEIPEGLSMWSVTGMENGVLVTVEETGKMKRNTPYLVSGVAGDYEFVGPVVAEGTYTSGLLTGTTCSSVQYAPKNSYVLQSQSGSLGFFKVENDNSQKCKQYRAYLNQLPGGVSPRSFSLLGDGTPTLVGNVAGDTVEGLAYDLYGRRVSSDSKGFVVIDGVKYLRK